ncbi:radical SAM protein [bacterium]|nr:radical SAM protein [bacterium]
MTARLTPGSVELGAAELSRRAEELRRRGAPCAWCPRACGADRLKGERGACGATDEVLIASAQLHFGEERHFVGNGGSGTVFFSCCNLGCLFCQNYDISHLRGGIPVSADELATVCCSLQSQGAENLNLVTPSHYPADILAALAKTVESGFSLPVVWNSGGYDSVATLEYFDGVVDVYMPDFKFATDALGARLTQVADYASVAKAALAEMVRQVGPGLAKETGVARRGMSVRHLVMPGFYDNSRACLDFLAEMSPEITVNMMAQYRPCYQANTVPELRRGVDYAEYRALIEYGHKIGLRNVMAQ